MIFICVKWKVRPEYAEEWPELTRKFTEATRAEPGNLFFQWSRSVEDRDEYVLIEAFADDAAEAHVTSTHFKQAQRELPQYVQATPLIRNVRMDGDHWDTLGEFEVSQSVARTRRRVVKRVLLPRVCIQSRTSPPSKPRISSNRRTPTDRA